MRVDERDWNHDTNEVKKCCNVLWRKNRKPALQRSASSRVIVRHSSGFSQANSGGSTALGPDLQNILGKFQSSALSSSYIYPQLRS